MISKALATAGTATAAAAVWFAAPWQPVESEGLFGDIGPREACACLPAVSPPQQKWANCSIRVLDAAGRLEDIVIDKNRPTGFASAVKEAELKCGTFDAAYADASELQKRRDAAGYAEYEVLQSAEGLFAGWTADDLRRQAGIPLKRDGSI